jgi:hypothetical protein
MKKCSSSNVLIGTRIKQLGTEAIRREKGQSEENP